MLKEIEDYFNHNNNYGYNNNTIEQKFYGIRKLNDFLMKESITDFKTLDSSFGINYEKYLKELQFSKSTIKKYLDLMKNFFNYLVFTGVIKENPFTKNKKKPSYSDELKKCFDEYFKIKQYEIKSLNSLKRIKASINKLFIFFDELGITTLNQITKKDIKSFISYLIEKEDKKGDRIYKPVSINRMLFDIKYFFLFLKNKGITPDVLGAVIYLRQAKKLSRNILTKKEAANLFKVEVKNQYEFMMKTIFVCLYSTGLRVGELLSLKMEDVDYFNKVLIIYESKTKKERYVHIGEVGINYLKIYLAHVRANIGYSPDKTNHIFISNKEDSKLSLQSINTYLKLFCKKAGITKEITSHCFRHSYGSHLLENGADIKIISELLGHAEISSTERYTKLGSERLREIVNTFHPREKETNKWN